MSAVDTGTKVLRPEDVTEAALAGLHESAAALLTEAVAAQPAAEATRPDGELYRGRHHTNESATKKITGTAIAAVLGVPLPARAPGAALAGEAAVRAGRHRRSSVLATALRALRNAR